MFQQDGAPCHFALHASFYLRNFLTDGLEEVDLFIYFFLFWSPRSPDLTSLDFFLWGHMNFMGACET